MENQAKHQVITNNYQLKIWWHLLGIFIPNTLEYSFILIRC